jgi:hypothetical protein
MFGAEDTGRDLHGKIVNASGHDSVQCQRRIAGSTEELTAGYSAVRNQNLAKVEIYAMAIT